MTLLEGLMIAGMFTIFVILMIPLLLGIAWKSGYANKLFFTIETGNIGFVDKGESNRFTYINIPGKILRYGVEVDGIMINDWVMISEEYPGQSEKEKTLIQDWFGQYWIGFPFLGRTVHQIPLTKKKQSPGLRPNMPPEEWISGSDEIIHVSQLRSKFPRPVLVPDMKFGDGIEANILVLGNYEVVIPRQTVYIQKGDFFDVIVSHTRTGMKAYAQRMSANDFKGKDHVEGGEMSQQIVAMINQTLLKECGVRLIGVSIPVYNLSSDAEEQATKAEELARLQGLATIAEARAKAEAKKIDAEAEAEADNIRNAASITDVTLAARALIDMGAHPDIATQGAVSVGRATRYTHPDSKVVTQVEGGNTSFAIAPTERNSALANK